MTTETEKDDSAKDDSAPVAHLKRWRRRVRRTRTGRISLKVAVTVVGVVLIAGGLALVPLPGPGWLIVIVGLAVLGLEYTWAQRLLQFTRKWVTRWGKWVGRQRWWVKVLIGIATALFVAVVVWLAVKFSLGIDLVAKAVHYFATH